MTSFAHLGFAGTAGRHVFKSIAAVLTLAFGGGAGAAALAAYAPLPEIEPLLNDANPPMAADAPLAEMSAPQWISGPSTSGYYSTCSPPFDGDEQVLTHSRLAVWAAVDGSYPQVGQVYYVSLAVGGVGSGSCAANYPQVYLQFVLAKFTSLYISAETPVYCFMGDIGQNNSAPVEPCPQVPTVGVNDRGQLAYGFNLPSPTITWPIKGKVLELQIPVVSYQTLQGGPNNPDSYFTGSVRQLIDPMLLNCDHFDGVTYPHCPATDLYPEWVYPQQVIWVSPNPDIVFGFGGIGGFESVQ